MRPHACVLVLCVLFLVAFLVVPAAAESRNSSAFAGAFVTIDPVGTPEAGTAFTVTGTTNLGTWDEFIYFYIAQAGHPGKKGTPFYMTNVSLSRAAGNTTWSVEVDPGRWLMYPESGNASVPVQAAVQPGEYVVYVATPTGEGPEQARSRSFVITAPGEGAVPAATTLPVTMTSTEPKGVTGDLPTAKAASLPPLTTAAAAAMGTVFFTLYRSKRRG